LSSERLGVIAKLDLIEVEDGAVQPVDYKRGRRRLAVRAGRRRGA
jgi:CRISPR-associated protein Cas1